MRILITGANGQVGRELARVLNTRHELLLTDHATLDITRRETVARIVTAGPDLVVHPAAWTDVDGCARDPDRAYRVNALGAWHVALACQHLDKPLIYISTNEVFDGQASAPYLEWDTPNPINPYARSKYAGEQSVRELLDNFAIVRIAWVLGGQRNFVRTIQRLARERDRLQVVDDEVGNPTFAVDLAIAIERLIEEQAYGTFHLVNEGYCSRYTFAREILRQAGLDHVAVEPIKLRDYQRASTPPAFAPLRNFVAATSLDIKLPPWQDALARFLHAEPAPA